MAVKNSTTGLLTTKGIRQVDRGFLHDAEVGTRIQNLDDSGNFVGASPDVEFKDSDAAAGDVNASIVVSATDTGDGSEDVDVTFSQQIDGTLTAFLTADADGNITTGSGRTVVLDNITVGGGYGSTGVTVSDAGVVQANGAITSDGTVTGADILVSGASPDVEFKDSDAAAGDVNASIVVSATDTGDGSEDVDVTLSQQIDGTLTAFLTSDADGRIVFGSQRTLEMPQATNSAYIAAADQANQANMYTIPDADGDVYFAVSSQSDGSVAGADLKASLADRVAYVATSFNDEADGSGTLTIQAKDAAGNNLAERIMVEVWIGTAQDYGEDAASTDLSVATGTQREEITANAAYRVVSDATGQIIMEFDNGGAGTYYGWVEFNGKVVEQTMTVTA